MTLPAGAKKTKKARKIFFAVPILCLAVAGAYLWTGGRFISRAPVVFTMWHNPTGQEKGALGQAIDRFNSSVGKEKGIRVVATSMNTSDILHERLMSIADETPGAPDAPDVVIAYPKSVMRLIAGGLLVAFDDCFTEEELSACVPSFIDGGRLHDGKLYVFPIGKSTEGLIVNRTLWDRFSAETGMPLTELGTFEGLARAGKKYYEWTDAQTPETEGDGRAFFMVDSPFNMAQAAFAQLGEEFFTDGRMNTGSPVHRKVWETLFEPMAKGWAAIYRGYGTNLAKIGDVVCWTTSTAVISFVPKNVIYADNTSEPVEFEILPFPVMEGGRKAAIQRGGGFCLFKSTPRKQRAVVEFLKWLTEPEENLRYVEGTGYMPVTLKALETARVSWEKNAAGIQKSFVGMMDVMSREYRFIMQKPLENYGELEILYENRLRTISARAREKYRALLSQGAEYAWDMVVEGAYEKFIE
jgi:multiple sugar transport system substrate-binding protein